MKKRIIKSIIWLLILYALYGVISGAVIFRFMEPKITDYVNLSTERFYSDSEGPDRVILLEDGFDAGRAKINLIDQAETSIELAYFSISDGHYPWLFINSLIEASQRGVQIKIVVDALSSRNFIQEYYDSLSKLPNIEIKVYEPLNLLKPWANQNRLHDKIIIIDEKIAFIGGRNIGNRYYRPKDYQGHATNDREVLVYHNNENVDLSVLSQFTSYFNELWTSPYSKYPKLLIKNSQSLEPIKQYVQNYRQENPQYFEPFNWLELGVATSKVTLIHNPLTRFNKEPRILMDLNQLMTKSNEQMLIQSPYIVPTKQMLNYIEQDQINFSKLTFLTNSIELNPNVLGVHGYWNKRKDIIQKGVNIYEYNGAHSLHAKSMVFDNRLTLIGSFNLDSRSTFLSTETMLVIDSVDFASITANTITSYFENSYYVSKTEDQAAPLKKSFLDFILLPFAELIDFLI